MTIQLVEKNALRSHTNTTSNVVTENHLAALPVPVQRYLRYSGVVGQPWINTVHLKYNGRFRMARDKPWMSVGVEQFYTINPPGFLWKATFKIAGIPFMFANDLYKDGHSRMHGKLLGLYTIVDGQGKEIDQGTMVRYLQEMTWFPTAFLYDNISWSYVDDHAADVTFYDAGQSVTMRMFFDDEGRLLSCVAQRYGDFNGQYLIRTWATPTIEYDIFNGLKVPARGVGVWQLPTGDFSYVDVQLKDIRYNETNELASI